MVKSTKPQFKTITKTTVLEPYKNMTHFAEKPYSSTHNSSRNPIKKIFTNTLYKKLIYETNTPDRECRNMP